MINSHTDPVVRPGVVVGWAVGGCVAAVFAFFVWAFFIHDPRRDIDLGAWVGPQSGYDRAMMPNARWATDEMCGEAMPCMQAVTSDTLTLYRFEHRALAEAYADELGHDGYLTGWIVVRYEPGGLTAAQRTDFEYGISCINTWVGEEGQDC